MSPNMIGGLMMLTALSSCVLSLPVTPSQLENEDVKVMKCIVEVLADVLSRQQHVPVSQDCLEKLKTDDRLVTILRHHNFLKELQEIAVQGDQERAQLQKETPTTQSLQTTDEAADRSMLEALGGPGERSILAQKKTDESLEEAEDDMKRMEEESDEKRANSGEASEEEESKGGEKRDAPRNKSKEKRVHEEHEEEEDKRSDVFSHKQREEGEEGPRRWTKRTKALQGKKKAVQQHEVPHHSKELTEEEEEEEEEQRKKKRGVNHRSPEEKELQMIARRPPEERRAMEEEGSASRKSEDPEIESLAAIESELENVAQKLHELRRG
uniref:Chromogranin-A n=1 Tax=Acanthochromis polyacanthus TaxID=80966 RepID=A0A3Q1ESL9_9TELE